MEGAPRTPNRRERDVPGLFSAPSFASGDHSHPNPQVLFPGQGLREKVISGIQWVKVWKAVFRHRDRDMHIIGDEAELGMFKEMQVSVMTGGQELGLE